MSVSSSTPTHSIPIDLGLYGETINELHSYNTSPEHGCLTQAELSHYYQQRQVNAEIPYRVLGYQSLLDLLSSDQRLFTIHLHGQTPYIYSTIKLQHPPQHELDPFIDIFSVDQNAYGQLSSHSSNAYYGGGFPNDLNLRLSSASSSVSSSIRENLSMTRI